MYRLNRLITKGRLISASSFCKKSAFRILEEASVERTRFSQQLQRYGYITATIHSSSQHNIDRSSEHDADPAENSADKEGLDDKSKASLQAQDNAQEAPSSQRTVSAATVRKELEANLPTLKYPKHYKVICTSNPRKMDAHITNLLSKKETVFGLDIEWPPQFKKGQPQNKTSLIQICSQDTILLFQVAKLKSLPNELVRFLNNPILFKSGVSIFGDATKLFKDFKVITDGLVELDIMTKHVHSPLLEKTHLRSLSVLTCLFLKKKLPKTKSVRLSNWARVALTEKQKEYAALDAYASYQLCVMFRNMLLVQKKTHITTFIIHLSKSQPKPKSKAEKPESKPEVQPESKPEVQPESKPEVQPESKPEVQPESKPEVQPKSKGTSKTSQTTTVIIQKRLSK